MAGFTSGEGCFHVSVRKSSAYKLGFNVSLVFMVGQHYKDELLLKSFIDYFNCGRFHHRGSSSDIREYVVTKLSDIESKIVPFFKNYPIHGTKSKDFEG